MALNIYTTPPSWFKKFRGNEKVELKLTKRGWEAIYPNGRSEIVIAMKNVPAEYLGNAPKKVEKAPEVKPEPVVEVKETEVDVKEDVKEETPEVKEEEAPVVEEAPKKKGRSKKPQQVDE